MITPVKIVNGTPFACGPAGCERPLRTFYGKSQDVVANGDGSYSIPEITDAKDSETFCAKDTGLTLIYDAEDAAWWDSLAL